MTEQASAGSVRSPLLIGREGALARLLEVAAHPPGLAIVQGEAGVGKTRLVSELIGDPGLAGRRVLLGQCQHLREPFPLGCVIEALRGILSESPRVPLSAVTGALRPLLPEIAAQLPRRPKPLSDHRAERHRVFRGLRALLDCAGPLVCVLEDLHWADEGTLEFLAFLVADPPADLILVLTSRSEEPEVSPSSPAVLACRVPSGASKAVVELSGLREADMPALVSAILQTDDVSARFTAWLHERSAGIPFAVEEILALILGRGRRSLVSDPRPDEALRQLGVPDAFRLLTVERMRSFDCDARQIAYVAAVVGRPADEELIRKVAGLSAARAARAIGEALSSTLMCEQKPGMYGFRHALSAQAVYEHIPGPERRQLHLRAAAALERASGPRALDQLAHHFRHADRRRQFLFYAEAAAAAATSVGDDRDAARILEHALADPQLPRACRVRMANKLGETALFARVPRAAISTIQRTLDDATVSMGQRGELRLSLARLMLLAGDEAGAHRELVRAASELRRRPRLAALALSLRAEAGFGRAEDRLSCADRAQELSSRHEDAAVKLRARAVRACVLIENGELRGWQVLERLPWQASSPQERLELVRACKYAAQAALGLGHFARCADSLDRADRISDELGLERFGVGLATVRGCLDWSSGRWSGLEDTVGRLVGLSREAPRMATTNLLTLASLRLARGEVEDAEARLLSLLGTVHDAQLPWVTSGLVRLYMARGNADEARELATEGLDRVRRIDLWRWSPRGVALAIDVIAAAGAVRQARDVAREFHHGLRNLNAPAARAALAFCRGAIAQADGRGDLAVRWFARSERAWLRLPDPYQASLARERRGLCLLAESDAGRSCLIGALRGFDDLGASWDVARTRTHLRARGVDVPYPWRGGRRGYGDALSPREAQVVRLARCGRTNREIASSLFISHRTVEEHVASALVKLDLGSKRDLISWQARDP